MPRVSILLPVYNGEKFLDEALTSLVQQSYTDFEILVIDDGSTDQSVNIIQRWQTADRRIRLIHNSTPHGLPYALNRGLREAIGEYIARADQDDVHRPGRLAAQINFLTNHPKIMLVGTAYQPFSADGHKPPIIHPTDPPAIAWKMLTTSAFCHPSVMFRRRLYTMIEGYPITGSEDFAYFSKIVRQWPTANLRQVFIDYREHGMNYSVTRRDEMAKSVMATYQKNFEFYLGTKGSVIVFYNFLVRRHIVPKNITGVSQMCWQITQIIRKNYHLSRLNPDILQLQLHIIKELAVVVGRSLLGFKPIGPEFR